MRRQRDIHAKWGSEVHGQEVTRTQADDPPRLLFGRSAGPCGGIGHRRRCRAVCCDARPEFRYEELRVHLDEHRRRAAVSGIQAKRGASQRRWFRKFACTDPEGNRYGKAPGSLWYGPSEERDRRWPRPASCAWRARHALRLSFPYAPSRLRHGHQGDRPLHHARAGAGV